MIHQWCVNDAWTICKWYRNDVRWKWIETDCDQSKWIIAEVIKNVGNYELSQAGPFFLLGGWTQGLPYIYLRWLIVLSLNFPTKYHTISSESPLSTLPGSIRTLNHRQDILPIQPKLPIKSPINPPSPGNKNQAFYIFKQKLAAPVEPMIMVFFEFILCVQFP